MDPLAAAKGPTSKEGRKRGGERGGERVEGGGRKGKEREGKERGLVPNCKFK